MTDKQAASKRDPAGLRAAMTHPVLIAFYDHWRALGQGGRLPSREQVDPIELRELLPWMFMIDVTTGPPRPAFRYRLAGTGITAQYGFDFTGQTVREAFPSGADQLIAEYSEVVIHRRPTYHKYPVPVPERNYKTVERLTCPLASDGEAVDILVGVLGFS